MLVAHRNAHGLEELIASYVNDALILGQVRRWSPFLRARRV